MIDIRHVEAKLDRAEANLNALGEEVRKFTEADSQAATISDRYDAIDQTHSAVFKERVPVPQIDWGVRLGEVVYQMRGALDYLVTLLVLEAGQQVHSEHQFPIVDSKHEWKRRVVNPPLKSPPRLGYLDFVSPEHVALIQSLQPYQTSTGLPSLLLIRRFWAADRHQLIRAARVSALDQPRLEATAAFPVALNAVTYPNPGSALEDGTEISRYEPDLRALFRHLAEGVFVPANTQVHVHVPLKTMIVFGDPGFEYATFGDIHDCLTDIRAKVIDRFVAPLSHES